MLSFGPGIFPKELNSTSLASIEKQGSPSSPSPAPGFLPLSFWSYPVTEILIFSWTGRGKSGTKNGVLLPSYLFRWDTGEEITLCNWLSRERSNVALKTPAPGLAPGLIDKDWQREHGEAGRGAEGERRQRGFGFHRGQCGALWGTWPWRPERVLGEVALRARGSVERAGRPAGPPTPGRERGRGAGPGGCRVAVTWPPLPGRGCVLPGWRLSGAGPEPGSASAASPRGPPSSARDSQASPRR